MIITSTFSLLAVSFTKTRGLALGIAATIASIGGIVFPSFINVVFEINDYQTGI